MSLLDFLGFKTWWLQSQEPPFQLMQGQFEPVGMTENISNNYVRYQSLNAAHPVIQFLNGNADTLSFQARLFARDFVFGVQGVKNDLDTLKSWIRRDDQIKRPHVLSFWVGDGHLTIDKCVITSLSPIAYDPPGEFGQIRGVTVTVNLEKYEPYSLEDGGIFDTRYHRVREGDYYELLCYREYGNPNFGDVIRKRHPTKLGLGIADIVKLPSVESIRRETIEPKSLVLETAFGKKATVQRTAFLDMLDKRNRDYISHVVVE